MVRPLSLTVLALATLLFVSTKAVFSQFAETDNPGFSLSWSKPVGPLKAVSLSPEGRRLALITATGKLALWTAQQGVPVWSVATQPQSNVAVSDGAGFVVTWDTRNLIDRRLVIRRADTGDVVARKELDGAVWSVALSQNGLHAAAGSGSDSVYLYSLSANPGYKRYSLDGIPYSLAFDPDDHWLAVGQWNSSGVRCMDFTGKTLWHTLGPTDRQYQVYTPGSRYVFAIAWSNRSHSSPVLYALHSDTGALLWAYNLENGSQEPVASVTKTLDLAAIWYSLPVRRRSTTAMEQRLTVIDRTGQLEWEKGGLFVTPALIGLTPDQNGLVVYDGQRTLWRLDREGRVTAHAGLSSTLQSWSESTDGKSLIVYTDDGQLSLLQVQ